ncbi:uncharacterized protein LOC135399167 isoform X2 [Ornithodoros turicata]
MTDENRRISEASEEEEDHVVAFTGVIGTVSHLTDVQGVIAVAHPLKWVVLFGVPAFEDGVYNNFRQANLSVGDMVVMDATLSPQDTRKDVFEASRVTRYEEPQTQPDVDSPFAPNGLEEHGTVQSFGRMFGFITFGTGMRKLAFFHAADVKLGNEYLDLGNIPLDHVMRVGDKVLLRTVKNDRRRSKARWRAEVVYVE